MTLRGRTCACCGSRNTRVRRVTDEKNPKTNIVDRTKREHWCLACGAKWFSYQHDDENISCPVIPNSPSTSA